MGKKGRGKEGMVRCEKCGRLTRRDKAVFIEKPMLTMPLERNQVTEQESYRRAIFREVCYCISCGKHGRIFEKKKQMLQRQRERAQERRMGGGAPRPQPYRNYGSKPAETQPQSAPQQPAEEKPADSTGGQAQEEQKETPSSHEA